MAKPKNIAKKIESQLAHTMTADRYHLRRELRRIMRARLSEEKKQQRYTVLEKKLRASLQKKERRKAGCPRITDQDALPITQKKDEIIAAIQKHPVLVISGDTGSGKSTQIPKFCLAAGRGINGMIGCSQPRRIAATTIARRIAEELGEDMGQSVGYKIRFSDHTHPATYIKMMTDGMLLAETHSDPYLNHYDTLIVDEAHERSLNIDFILGILRNLLKRRKDLKLIITSATIDTEKFSKAFENAPIIEVSGRMFPVEVRYQNESLENGDATHIDLAVEAVHRLQRESPYGDILVFMPTEQDIRDTCDLIEGRGYPGVTVLPLFARLSASAQSKVFSRPAGRKIIVATNVAETSITLPGIRYVVDTGLARISRYSPRTRTTALPVVPVSKSSADQRKGRCGRVENGICVRLYPEDEFESRSMFTPPEILRSNLAEVILRMIALNLGDIAGFPFIDRPAPKNIKDGFDLLMEIGAITLAPNKASGHTLTENGRLMAKIPIDPRLSRMLIQAQDEACLPEVMIIASALTLQDPRERPAEKQKAADSIHKTFQDPQSDFITLLNIWNRYHDTLRVEKTASAMKRFCRNHFLSYKRMREWRDIHVQIRGILKDADFTPRQEKPKPSPPEDSSFPERYGAVHRSILSGFLSNIAQKKELNFFRATKGREAMIFPGSSIFNRSGKWIMAAEMVETSRLFARSAANIDNRWIEKIGARQCKYTYLNPRWSKNRGAVMATEQVSLYGLIIDSGRPVNYGPINPAEAADIFLKDALIPGDIKEPLGFLKHNMALIEDIVGIEDRVRRRDLLVEEEALYCFYSERLAGISDVRMLRKAIKKKGSDDFLKLDKATLLRYDPDDQELCLYPDRLSMGGNAFSCDYRFDPGNPDDGVTVKVPLTAASAVPPHAVDWLVPGLLKEKVAALIRSLPKGFRKKLVPISNTVEIIIEEMPKKDTSLANALSRFIYKRFRVDIPATAWILEDLPDHLNLRIALTDPAGRAVRTGRDKSLLNHTMAPKEEIQGIDRVRKGWEKDGITRWDFGDLPESIDVSGKDKIRWQYYPGLEKKENGISLRLFSNLNQAREAHKKGVAGLFDRVYSKDLKFLKKALALPRDLNTKTKYFGGIKAVENQLYGAVTSELFSKDIRSENEFEAWAASVKPTLHQKGIAKKEGVVAVISVYHDTRTAFFQLETANAGNARVDAFLSRLRADLEKLIPENFIKLYETERLGNLIRYITAMARRAQRGVFDLEKDQIRQKELKIHTDRLNELLNSLTPAVSKEKRNEIESFFWQIEEYTVSLFAQELGTAMPVSKKRLDTKFKEIQRML
jgi:ATP-dependent helicase HrpA